MSSDGKMAELLTPPPDATSKRKAVRASKVSGRRTATSSWYGPAMLMRAS